MRQVLAVALLFTLLHTSALATAQSPDVLIYENKVYDLFANPLESFYKDGAGRPGFQIQPGVVSTGNWRGYTAIWEVEGDSLLLRGVDSWLCDPRDSENCRRADLKELFGEKLRGNRVEATWFSGELRIPDGKMLQYVHMGYGSVYERDIILTVRAGRITNKSVVDNTKRKLPSELELQRQELEKLKDSPAGKKKVIP
jgi:hypothetical protein